MGSSFGPEGIAKSDPDHPELARLLDAKRAEGSNMPRVQQRPVHVAVVMGVRK